MKQRKRKLEHQAKKFVTLRAGLRFEGIIQRAIAHPATDYVASAR